MNYISRIVRKPDMAQRKGDRMQIVDLLRAQGFNPTLPDHLASLRRYVEAHFQVSAVPVALGVLEQIITAAMALPRTA